MNLPSFAFYTRGAGTYQEYMILDKYLEEISPDIILWQYCPNDFINNSYDLELKTRQNYNGMIRPYLEDGETVYRLPLPYSKAILFLISHSHVLRFVFGQLYLIQVNNSESIETEIIEQGFDHSGFIESYQTTDKILAMVKQRADNIPIFAFNCSYTQPFHRAFKKLSQDHDIYFIEMDVTAIGRRTGEVIFARDGGHWNEIGHSIAGEVISRHLNKQLSYCKK